MPTRDTEDRKRDGATGGVAANVVSDAWQQRTFMFNLLGAYPQALNFEASMGADRQAIGTLSSGEPHL